MNEAEPTITPAPTASGSAAPEPVAPDVQPSDVAAETAGTGAEQQVPGSALPPGPADDAAPHPVSESTLAPVAADAGVQISALDGAPAATEDVPPRLVPETGFAVAGPFRAFYEHYGPTLCGFPISDVRLEDGRRCQYFQCLALEEHAPGRVRLKPLGEAWLALASAAAEATPAAEPALVDLSARLPRHPRLRYPTRTLADIRYLVIHHTGAGPELGPEAIAAEHVESNGWPGIGYHFVVSLDGVVFRTQDLTVVSYHTRQFNPAAVGIALVGDLASASPIPAQLAATAGLVARLLADLGLPPDALRGHREIVPTTCPGDWFLSGWKVDLERAVAAQLVRAGLPEAVAGDERPVAVPLPAAPHPGT